MPLQATKQIHSCGNYQRIVRQCDCTGHLFSLSCPKRQRWLASIVFKRWWLLVFAGNLSRVAQGTRQKEVSVSVFVSKLRDNGESIFQCSVGFCVCVSLGRCTWLISLFFRGVKSACSLPEILFFLPSFIVKSGEWPLPVSRYEKFMVSSLFEPLCQHLKILYFTLAPLWWSMINKLQKPPALAGNTLGLANK